MMVKQRRRTHAVRVGSLVIGGDAPISVQSMTKTDTRDILSTVSEIRRLEEKGCDLVRVAVPDMEAATCLHSIKKQISIPLIADIHFDHRLALAAIEAGVDGLRLNPGNIHQREYVKEVVKAASNHDLPIRVGVNAGSLTIPEGKKETLDGKDEKDYREEIAKLMVESAYQHVDILETADFGNIIISLKSSDVSTTIRAYQLMAERNDYPFHLGVTAAGMTLPGTVRNSAGISILLSQGLGDTIRVSLTADSCTEVVVGNEILRSLGLERPGITIISCPTCGRVRIDVIRVVEALEQRISAFKLRSTAFTVAVMGCEVNGPGEASEADIGIAGGRGVGLLFRRGVIICKVPEAEIVETLAKEIEKEL